MIPCRGGGGTTTATVGVSKIVEATPPTVPVWAVGVGNWVAIIGRGHAVVSSRSGRHGRGRRIVYWQSVRGPGLGGIVVVIGRGGVVGGRLVVGLCLKMLM